MELGAEVADQFLSEMNQTKIKIQDAKKQQRQLEMLLKASLKMLKDYRTT